MAEGVKPCTIIGNQRGVTYMVVLVMVVVLGLGAGIAGSTWQTIVQRSREKELLFRGDQYRRAIGSYYRHAHAGAQALFPHSLEDLLRDPRSLETLRHIRKLDPDPMTGEEWVLIRQGGTVEGASGATGRIIGVRSASEREPFKKEGFAPENEDFAKAETYSGWEFIYKPEEDDTLPPPAQAPGAPGGIPGNQGPGQGMPGANPQ